eukprot:6756349-Alexandrium_andersonii.AAC.1
MSASLVGSEMCIRDSFMRLVPDFVSACAPAVGDGVPMGSRESLPLSPVSYTHLTLPTICSV